MPKKIICLILLLNIWVIGETSKDFLKLAITSSEKGFFDLSNKYLEEYIAKEKENLDYAYLLYGYNFIKLENYTQAIEKFKVIIEKFPLSPYLKDVYLFIIPAYLKRGDIFSAVEYYRDFKKKWKKDKELENQICQVLLDKGISLFKEKKYQESYQILNLICEEFSENIYFIDWTYYYKGLIEFELNRFSSAREYFLKVSPSSEKKIFLDSRLKIGDCYFNEKDYEKAENYYKELLKYPETIFSQWAKFQLAIIEKRKGNYENSKKLLKEIDYKQDENLKFNVLNEIANIEILVENLENAERVLKKILEEFPEKELSEIYFKLGNINFNKRDFEKSKYYFKKVIDDSKDKSLIEKSLFLTGYIYYLEKKFQEAETTWEILKKEYPESLFIEQVLFLCGKRFYENNNLEKAEEIFYSLIKNPSSSYYRESSFFLLEILIKRNKLSGAENLAREYLRENDDKKVKFLLGKILYLSEKFNQAREIFENLQIDNVALKAEMSYYLASIYKKQGEIEKAKEKYIEIISLYPQFKEWKEIAEMELKELKK